MQPAHRPHHTRFIPRSRTHLHHDRNHPIIRSSSCRAAAAVWAAGAPRGRCHGGPRIASRAQAAVGAGRKDPGGRGTVLGRPAGLIESRSRVGPAASLGCPDARWREAGGDGDDPGGRGKRRVAADADRDSRSEVARARHAANLDAHRECGPPPESVSRASPSSGNQQIVGAVVLRDAYRERHHPPGSPRREPSGMREVSRGG